MSKTKKHVLLGIALIVIIVALSIGIYINKQVISIIIGAIGMLVLETIVYYLKGWDKEEDDIATLKQAKNKAIDKCHYFLDNDVIKINNHKYIKQENNDIITKCILDILENKQEKVSKK